MIPQAHQVTNTNTNTNTNTCSTYQVAKMHFSLHLKICNENHLTHHCNELVEQNHLPACNNPRTQSNSRTLALTPFNRFHNTVFLSTSFLFAFFCNANLRSYLILIFTLEIMSKVSNFVFIGLYFLPL